jgi:threonylcarbamoyladenosine tRNA methylthiotransferase MtaB
MNSQRRFFVQNFGCRATQADGAAIAADLSARGLIAAGQRSAADMVVINTCSVTAEADQDARQAVRRVHRENPGVEILVTGCYAQRSPQDLAGLPGVKWVVGNSHKTVIGEVVAPKLVTIQSPEPSCAVAYHGEIALGGTLVGDIFEQRAFLSAPVVEAAADRTRPNLKIQDGCHNRCSFCVIPSVRGNSRSAPANRVVDQVRDLSQRYVEVVLTGINLGRWGRDLDDRPRLAGLLRRLLAETDIRKLRLSSVEPMDWTDELLELMASSDRIAKHVHIPLQSGSDDILKAMRRRYRTRHYAGRVERARRMMPCAAIGADVMVGFPGETDRQFEETRRFVAEMPFTYLHVFSYSSRPGTESSSLSGEPPKAVKRLRSRVLRELAAQKNLTFRQSLVGRTFDAVTLERGEADRARALTDNYIPAVVEGRGIEPGRAVRLELTRCDQDGTTSRLV